LPHNSPTFFKAYINFSAIKIKSKFRKMRYQCQSAFKSDPPSASNIDPPLSMKF
jgi:hypothetical protein